MSGTAVRVRAPAKVNLALHVGPVRPDGFHRLATVYQAVDLFEEVTARPTARGAVVVRTEGAEGRQVPGVADDPGHLAVRAAEALRAYAGVRAGVDLHVRKLVPVAGGMAGGSADAAATLVACDALWELGSDRRTLLRLAAGLGSDVPFALLGGTAVGTGRGEVLRPVPGAATRTWLVVSGFGGLPTPRVYAELDRLRGAAGVLPALHPGLLDPLLAALPADDPRLLAAALHNDLHAAAVSLQPVLTEVIAAGTAAGAVAGTVSGSGPSVLLLVDGQTDGGARGGMEDRAQPDARPDAETTARRLRPVLRRLVPEATLSVVRGPVAGPMAGPSRPDPA